MGELRSKWKAVLKQYPNEPKAEQVRQAIRRYNGSGKAAEDYSHNVVYYTAVAEEVDG